MLFKKLVRTFFSYKAQFISMIIMISIGLGVFVGFNMEWKIIDKSVNTYFEETNFPDYFVYSENIFNNDDLTKIKNIDGVSDASLYLSMQTNVVDTDKTLFLTCMNEKYLDFKYIEGEEYNVDLDGVWLSDKYALKNNIKIGDKIKVKYNTITIEREVIGTIKSSMYLICVQSTSQLMPDYEACGYFFISPKSLIKEFNKYGLQNISYPEIIISSKLEKKVIEEEINKALSKTNLVLGRDANVNYSGPSGEIEEGKTMGSIIPVLFLVIAILTMVTTMHRITNNERIQIGTLKALGFKDRRIIFHYSAYGLFIGVIGSIIGIAFGFLIAYYIIFSGNMMSIYLDLPKWYWAMPAFCYVSLILLNLFLLLTCFLSVYSNLKGMPVEALRGKNIGKVRRGLLDKWAIGRHLGFANVYNIRDLKRHKSRSFMTLFGVVGCMILLVAAFAMKETFKSFLDTINNDIYTYNSQISLSANTTNSKVVELMDLYEADSKGSLSISLDDEAISLDIYDIKYNNINIMDKNNKRIAIPNDGALICMRVADMGYKVGDVITIAPYGTNEKYMFPIKGIIRSFTEKNVIINSEYAKNISLNYQIQNLYTKTKASDISENEFVDSIQTKEAIMKSFNSMTDMMNLSITVLTIASVVLGVVVLYNLGMMSYIERFKEMATLKVVGFNDRKIARLLISQNMWLTIIGIIIGLPLGLLTINEVVKSLASEYELKVKAGALTYLVSILLTFFVSLVVAMVVARRNKRIDMVSALKGID